MINSFKFVEAYFFRLVDFVSVGFEGGEIEPGRGALGIGMSDTRILSKVRKDHWVFYSVTSEPFPQR